MAWSACRRYRLSPAPGGLALVQDFLNTRPQLNAQVPDLLATVRAAQGWADEALVEWAEVYGRTPHKVKLAAADAEALRQLRTQLVAALRGRDGDGEPVVSVAALAEVEFCASAGPDGLVLLEPAGQGWRRLAAALAIEMHRAQMDNSFRRLKTCRNPCCPGAFYDRSPNNSGAWHDVRTCGNVANLRASRARRKAASA